MRNIWRGEEGNRRGKRRITVSLGECHGVLWEKGLHTLSLTETFFMTLKEKEGGEEKI